MVADKFTELQKAVGPEITKTDLVPAFQVSKQTNSMLTNKTSRAKSFSVEYPNNLIYFTEFVKGL